jgi:hypothetical protein
MAKAKDLRIGQELWLEWEGDWSPETSDSILYYTVDHVDVENEIVRRALASILQRDGIYDSLGDAFKAIDRGVVSVAWAGVLEGDFELALCNSLGETEYGDILESIQEITCVEVLK